MAADRLHPAEHRAYRELYVACRQLLNRWGRLSEAMKGTKVARALDSASAQVERLLAELGPRTAEYGLHAGPAAHGVGARIADVRGAVADRGADTGMVVRFAVLDIEHIATLLAHLSRLASTRGDAALAAFCDVWAASTRVEVKNVRKAAVALGEDPDRTAAPLDDSVTTRAAHRMGWLLGSVGEAVDRATAPRRDKEEPQETP
jgi:hypothetical protein